MRRGILVACSLCWMLAGCVSTWTRIEQPRVEERGYTLEAPAGWVRYNLNSDGVTITRDGLPIQFIDVSLRPAEKVFKQTKKTLPANALPAEVAALVLAELRARPGLADLTVEENSPALVAGRPGFRLRVRYHNERGTAFDRLVLGAVQGDELLVFSYHALTTYFFARDLVTFEQVVASYKPTKPK